MKKQTTTVYISDRDKQFDTELEARLDDAVFAMESKVSEDPDYKKYIDYLTANSIETQPADDTISLFLDVMIKYPDYFINMLRTASNLVNQINISKAQGAVMDPADDDLPF